MSQLKNAKPTLIVYNPMINIKICITVLTGKKQLALAKMSQKLAISDTELKISLKSKTGKKDIILAIILNKVAKIASIIIVTPHLLC